MILGEQQPDVLANSILQSRPLLLQKLTRALFCSADESRVALTEVIKFLSLAAENKDGQLTPSARIDIAWHEFILFTKTYSNFCQQYFGKMIHHEPSDDHEANSNQYARTLNSYRQRFGNPPPEFWGISQGNPSQVSASCGNCESEL